METQNKITPQIEALVFASPNPLSLEEIERLLDNTEVTTEQIKNSLRTLINRYKNPDFGFALETTATNEYHFQTKKELSPILERLFPQ